MAQGWYCALQCPDQALSGLRFQVLRDCSNVGLQSLIPASRKEKKEGLAPGNCINPCTSISLARTQLCGHSQLGRRLAMKTIFGSITQLKIGGSTTCRRREEQIVESGCRFYPQPGPWHTEIQRAFSSPRGAYGPVTMDCIPHGQRLCLIIFVTLMLPQYLAHTPFSKC